MKIIRELPWGKLGLAFLGFLFVLAMTFSVVFESLLPLWRAGNFKMFYRSLIGIPLIFLGVGLFVWSAILFMRDSFRAFDDPKMDERNQAVSSHQRGEPSHSPRSYRLPVLMRAWRSSLIVFLLAIVFIALGSWLAN